MYIPEDFPATTSLMVQSLTTKEQLEFAEENLYSVKERTVQCITIHKSAFHMYFHGGMKTFYNLRILAKTPLNCLRVG